LNIVTEESGLFMGKTPPCDDSDGNTGIILTSYEGEASQPQLGEYENNTDNTVTPSQAAQNTRKTQHSNCDDIEKKTVTDTSNTVTTPLEAPEFIHQSLESQLEQADALGLVARWSREFGYVSIHDPTSEAGKWHDLPTKDAPDWAKRECFKRTTLRKFKGITWLLTQSEMEEIWRKEEVEMWEHPAVDKRGLLYEDYLEEA